MELANSVAQQIYEKELTESVNEAPLYSQITQRVDQHIKRQELTNRQSNLGNDLHFEPENMSADLEAGDEGCRTAPKDLKFRLNVSADYSDISIHVDVNKSADRLVPPIELLDLPETQVEMRQARESPSFCIQKRDISAPPPALVPVEKSRTFEEPSKELSRVASTIYDKQRSLQQKKTTIESYFGSIDAPSEVPVDLIEDLETQFEHKKLKGVRTYCIGLQLLNLIFNIRIAMNLEGREHYDKAQRFSYMVAWLYILFALVKSFYDSIEWVYSALIVISFRNAFPLLDLEGENEGQLGMNMMITISLMVTTFNSVSFISSLKMKYKWVFNSILSLISLTGIMRHSFTWEQFLDPENLVILLVYIPTAVVFLGIFYNYQNFISSITFWQVVTQQHYNSELELILDNLEMGIVLIDEHDNHLNYFNEYSQDKFSRALPLKKRFSSAAANESQYFNRICNLKIFKEHLRTEEEDPEGGSMEDAACFDGDDPNKLSLNDILKMKTAARDSKVFSLRVYDSELTGTSNSSSPSSKGSATTLKKKSSRDQETEDDFVDRMLEQQSQVPSVQYLQIKKKEYKVEGKAKTLIQLVDISKSILYDQEHAKSELLALINVTVSHEMRNPLNSILGINTELGHLVKNFNGVLETLKERTMTNTFREEAPPPQDNTDLVHDMIALKSSLEKNKEAQTCSSKMLLYFIYDVIDFGHLHSDKFEKKEASFDLYQVVKEVVAVHRLQAESKEIDIDVHYKNFGEEGHYTLIGDGQRFQQVLMNLISNALKYTVRGSIKIKLRLAFDQQSSRWSLVTSVRDTGLGMSLVEKSKLFRLFGNSTKDQNSGGIGLGLVICRMIVEQYSGRITVNSVKSKGSLFAFSMRLPEDFDPSAYCKTEEFSFEEEAKEEGFKIVVEEESDDESIASADSFDPLDEGSLLEFSEDCMNQPRILVVDDFQFNIDALIIMLKIAGINPEKQVHKAMNGAEAIKQATQQKKGLHYTLIFMDCNMPIVDGYQASKSIIEFCKVNQVPPPKIFAVTGHVEEQYIKQALDSGMEQVFPKPVQIDQIKKALTLTQPKMKEEELDDEMCRRISRYRHSRKQSIKQRSTLTT